jgi:hypothetical protein
MGSPQIEITPGRSVAFAAAAIWPAERDTACGAAVRPAAPGNSGRAAGTTAGGCDSMPVVAGKSAAEAAG